jgi:amino acid adenylation domain-containing protein
VVRTHRGAVPGGPTILGPVMVSVPFHVRVEPASELAAWLRTVRGEWLALRAGDFAMPAQIRGWSELEPLSPLFETLVLFETHEITARLRRLGEQWQCRSFRYVRMPRVPLSVYGSLEERLQLKFIYDPASFDAVAMRRLLGQLALTMEAMPEGAGRAVAELPWLSAAERHQVLAEWNDNAAGGGGSEPVHRRFEVQARRAPQALAVAAAGETRTYAQVEERANRLASLLVARGLVPGSIVAVLLERSCEEVEALLAILKAGAAYLPLDGSTAAAVERLEAILSDAGTALLLTRSTLRPPLRFPAERVVELDLAAEELSRQPAEPPMTPVAAAQPAYVIYTSGSTGEPKGVVVPHHGLANLVDWHLRAFAVSAADRASRLAGLGFDASVWELWPYWSAGAAVLLPPEEVRSSPPALRDWLLGAGVTVAFAPTPLAERLVRLDWPGRTALRLLLTGGEALRSAPRAGLPFRLINNYGPSESSVVASSGEVAASEEAAFQERPRAIGRPIRNLCIRLLDGDFRPLPIGVCGRLMIAGSGLAQGYLGRADATAASFLPDPYGAAGERMYSTGDLARFLPDGRLEFIGRGDAQIKLRGFRIEPAEIEAALDRHPAIESSAVVCRDAGGTDGKQLLAFVAGRPGSGATAGELADFLRARLPSYMIPAVFVWRESLPLAASGKLDRKALAALAETISGHAAESVLPATPLERLLAQVWEDALGVQTIGLDDDFFALGGHSLHVMQVLATLREIFLCDAPADLVFLAPTVAQLIGELFPNEAERTAAEEIAASTLAGGAMTDRSAPGHP